MSIAVKLGCEEMARVYHEKAREKQELEREAQLGAQRRSERESQQRALQYKWANRVIDMRLAKTDPNTFLYELFCNENGHDEGVLQSNWMVWMMATELAYVMRPICLVYFIQHRYQKLWLSAPRRTIWQLRDCRRLILRLDG